MPRRLEQFIIRVVPVSILAAVQVLSGPLGKLRLALLYFAALLGTCDIHAKLW